MTFNTPTLWSKHRQRRVATKVVRRRERWNRRVRHGLVWKWQQKLRHSGRTQSPLSSSFPSISIMGVAVCGKFQCTSALASGDRSLSMISSRFCPMVPAAGRSSTGTAASSPSTTSRCFIPKSPKVTLDSLESYLHSDSIVVPLQSPILKIRSH